MSNDIIETVSGEEDSLELHVKLCEQRYKQLIGKFDTVEHRLDRLESHIVDIKDRLNIVGSSADKTYLKWAGVIILTLLGIVTHFILK
jgi:hypothetical protein